MNEKLDDLKILIIDDNEDARELLQFVLELNGANIKSAESVKDAIEKIKSSDYFDIILSDISMPDEDGYSLIKKIRNCSSGKVANVPAIAITAHSSKEYIEESIRSGFQCHISKPIEIDSLISVILELTKSKIVF